MFSDEIESLLNAIRPLQEDHSPVYVSIDGVGGSGKTTLGRMLADEMHAVLISLDSYLEPHQGVYVSSVDYQTLRREMHRETSEGCQLFIVEGICVLAVLRRLGLSPYFSIYLKQVTDSGRWKDESICSETSDLQEIYSFITRVEHHSHKPGIGNHDRELARYHHEFLPISTTDVVLEVHN